MANANMDHVFKNQYADDDDGNKDAIYNKNEDRFKAWLKHLEDSSGKYLAEGLQALQFEETRSTGNFDAINIGPKPVLNDGEVAKHFIPENPYAGINAVLAVASDKYETPLRPGIHVAWFNPKRNCEGVKSVLGGDGKWRFFDWSRTRGGFVRSRMSYDRYRKQAAKHTEIDAFLEAAQVYNEQYQIVLRGGVRGHYEDRIRNRVEMTLPEVWEAINGDYSEAKTKQHLHGRGIDRPEVKLSDEANDFLEKLGNQTEKQLVIYDTLYKAGCKTVFDPEKKDVFLSRARQDNGVTWVKFQPFVKQDS